MKVAFKQHRQNPNNQTTMANYPWIAEVIEDDREQEFSDQGFIVMYEVDYPAYVALHENEIVAWEREKTAKVLRIRELVHPDFKNYHPSKIDFTIHLNPNVLLKKKVTMAKNGRPTFAKYYNTDDKLVCEIRCDFIDNGSKFMIDRKEWLGYYQNDDTCPEYYLIHHRTYDFTNINEATESLQERVTARSNIIQEIKIVSQSFMVGMYMAQGQSVTTASLSSIVLGKTFFNAFRFEISDFIEIASNDFKNNIANTVDFPWLDGKINATTTLRQYIVDRLMY